MSWLYFFKANELNIPTSNGNPLRTYGPFSTIDEAEDWREVLKRRGYSVGMRYAAGKPHIELHNVIMPEDE